jgi:double-stranded uracil-DNA glycosylase
MRSVNSALPRPTKDALRAAAGRTLPDVIAVDLQVLFCGINPGLYSGATGYHFARPGNRFWPTLHRAGFTDRLFSPAEGRKLPELGLGLTNLVDRATARADELSADELVQGADRLEAKVRRYRPRCVAVLGVSAYRVAFARRSAVPGPQRETLSTAVLWVLPSPSGLNAHYQLDALARAYAELRRAVIGACG